jgi:uncharacterized protein YkwD
MKYAMFAPLMLALAACGGGGSAAVAAGPTPAGVPVTTPTPATGILVGGSVVQLPADAYGPATIAGVTYASADAAQTAPLVNATVIVGPLPIVGATPPATLPPGDVSTTTSAAGTFQALVAVPAAAPVSLEPFVIPQNNILGFVPPATGYYIEVFGAGTDGKSAGTPIPLHRFVAGSLQMNLRVSTISAAEAGALTVVNTDRAANGAGPLIFDQSAEEVARLHASDESTAGYTCHYDTKNVGPSSRYLATGGIGLTGEGLDLSFGPIASTAFQNNENAFMTEKTQVPPGGHFLNVVDTSHIWSGIAATQSVASPGFFNIDYDFVTPNALSTVVASFGYPTTGDCPPGTINNNS